MKMPHVTDLHSNKILHLPVGVFFNVIVMTRLVTAAPSVMLTFYDNALVNDTVFTIGDIARVTGTDMPLIRAVETTIAGRCAPPGYRRFITTDDLVAYHLKNRFPEAAFSTSGIKRIPVSTDFREIKLSDFAEQLQRYIEKNCGWKTGEWSVTVTNTDEKVKCLNCTPEVSFDGLKTRFPKGNRNLQCIVRQGTYTVQMPAYCSFTVHAAVMITRTAVERGAALTAENCELRVTDITRLGPDPFTSYKELNSTSAARLLKPGTIIHSRLVRKVPDVEKGDAVSIVLKEGRIAIAVAGIAREAGSVGERIWVQNTATRKLIRVQIQDKGVVAALQGGNTI